MPSLIARIKERIADVSRATDGAKVIKPKVAAPATEAEVRAAEEALGFPLPPLLRQLYLEVGNGGFGPGYGFIGVPRQVTAAARERLWPAQLAPVCDFDIVETYQAFAPEGPDDPEWQWPHNLLPACHLGCGMYDCIDCSTPPGAVSWFEPNPRERGDPVGDFLILLAPSLERRLDAWLTDEDLMERAYETSALKRRLDEYFDTRQLLTKYQTCSPAN
jgi:hypothetical protein